MIHITSFKKNPEVTAASCLQLKKQKVSEPQCIFPGSNVGQGQKQNINNVLIIYLLIRSKIPTGQAKCAGKMSLEKQPPSEKLTRTNKSNGRNRNSSLGKTSLGAAKCRLPILEHHPAEGGPHGVSMAPG